jgi:hypothetical protein
MFSTTQRSSRGPTRQGKCRVATKDAIKRVDPVITQPEPPRIAPSIQLLAENPDSPQRDGLRKANGNGEWTVPRGRGLRWPSDYLHDYLEPHPPQRWDGRTHRGRGKAIMRPLGLSANWCFQ